MHARMAAPLKLGLIIRHLRPQRRELLQGAVALVVVNLVGVSLPLLVQNTVNSLKEGFSLPQLLQRAASGGSAARSPTRPSPPASPSSS